MDTGIIHPFHPVFCDCFFRPGHTRLCRHLIVSLSINTCRPVKYPCCFATNDSFSAGLGSFFLEITIELLREAGARLPTKVGQTIGIVGGIVIGTASVEAGLTSNVLLIIVALSALASFTTPVYRIGNTIRLLRFPFLIFAELWGLLGIVVCLCFVTTHLLRLTSLGRPYLEPIYPPRLHDLKEAFVRPPLSTLRKRPQYLRTKKPARFSRKAAKEKKDIDE